MAYDLNITGAGNDDVNTDAWTLDGTNNGRPKWKITSPSTYYLFHFEDFFTFEPYWAIHTNTSPDPFFDDFYAVKSDAPAPPKFGWRAFNSAASPAPASVAGTLTGSEAAVVAGAGASGVNGRYVWAGIHNDRIALVHEDATYHIAWNGANKWQIRAGDAIGSGAVMYESAIDYYIHGDAGSAAPFEPVNGASPGPSTLTANTLALAEARVIRTDETVEADVWSVQNGSGETLDEVVGEDVDYPHAPASDDPHIATANPGTCRLRFSMPADAHQIMRVAALRVYGDLDDGVLRGSFGDGATWTNDPSMMSGAGSFHWTDPQVYDADNNSGGNIFPFDAPNDLQVRFQALGGGNLWQVRLVHAAIDYTHWQSGAAPAGPGPFFFRTFILPRGTR